MTCGPTQLRCDGASACQVSTWDFENGTQDWRGLDEPLPKQLPGLAGGEAIFQVAQDGGVATSRKQAHGGSTSLASRIRTGDGRAVYQAVHDLCGRNSKTGEALSPAVDLTPRTLSAWVYVEIETGSYGTGTCSVGGFGFVADKRATFGFASSSISITPGQWTNVSATLKEPAAAKAWQFTVDCRFPFTPAWTGVVYLDDVQISK